MHHAVRSTSLRRSLQRTEPRLPQHTTLPSSTERPRSLSPPLNVDSDATLESTARELPRLRLDIEIQKLPDTKIAEQGPGPRVGSAGSDGLASVSV